MVPRSENKWGVTVTAQELQDKKWTSLSVDSATLDCTSALSCLTLGPILTWSTPARLSLSEEAKLPESFSLC